MVIRRIHLENIGCFANRTFDVSHLSVIFGENRSGKSTLVYAIYFALFGSHLHKGLKIEDLSRKGEPYGAAVLYLGQPDGYVRLNRATSGEAGVYKYAEDRSWQPLVTEGQDSLKSCVPLSAEVAAITSFFREGELIWFLQDIPKYNKTLLQSLIGIDDALIMQSRFKKALTIAKERRKTIQIAAPAIRIHPDELRKQIADAQLQFQQIDDRYQQEIGSQYQVLTEFKTLQRRWDDAQKAIETALAAKGNLGSASDLKTRYAALEKQTAEKEGLLLRRGELQRQIGGFDQQESDLHLRIERLEHIERQASCPTCEQSLSNDHLSVLIPQLKNRLMDVVKHRLQAKESLQQIEIKLKNIQEAESLMKTLETQMAEISRLETQLAGLIQERNAADHAIQQFKSEHPDIANAQMQTAHHQTLETERRQLQQRVVDAMAQLKQYEREHEQAEKLENDAKRADRNELICTTAFKAIENAIRELSSGLLSKVRDSIREWTKLFTILEEFDIEMTDKELVPIIHAKGYQYKLNQMSKSERIFLYLLLKLAIGDALGHLGLFVLDDPADGLDVKRQQMLASLLTEVAQRRQVIVTTNDPNFAGLFDPASRINLSEK